MDKISFSVLLATLSLTACDAGDDRHADIAAPGEASAAAPVTAAAPSPFAEVPSGSYVLEKNHGYISFTYSHIGFSRPHIGFRDFDVALSLDSAEPQKSSLQVTIDADSVYSRVEEFDGHLRDTDYFDVANHPEITFTSTSVEPSEANKLTVTGELTIKGVTLPVELDATINKAAQHPISKQPTIGISATTTVNRSDWGMSKYTPLVGDEVTIYIEAEIHQPSEEG